MAWDYINSEHTFCYKWHKLHGVEYAFLHQSNAAVCSFGVKFKRYGTYLPDISTDGFDRSMFVHLVGTLTTLILMCSDPPMDGKRDITFCVSGWASGLGTE